MTKGKVTVQGGRHTLSLVGHATGSDTVCTAVSAIVYSLLGYLENAGEHVEAVRHREIGDGLVRLHVVGDSHVTAAWRMAYIGLLQIEKQHPEYIQLTVRDCEAGVPANGGAGEARRSSGFTSDDQEIK